MAEVIYDGPYAEVEFIDPVTGQRHVAKQGEPLKVRDEVAESLCEQDPWRDKNTKATPAAAEKAVEEGVNLSEVKGSGKDGKVTASDVAEAAKEDE